MVTTEAAVHERFGVAPGLLPDLHAVVGDCSDGLPGVPGWGIRSAGRGAAAYGSIEAIPLDGRWEVAVRGAERLAAALEERLLETLLCRDLAPPPYRPAPSDIRSTTCSGVEHAARSSTTGLSIDLGDAVALDRVTRWFGE